MIDAIKVKLVLDYGVEFDEVVLHGTPLVGDRIALPHPDHNTPFYLIVVAREWLVEDGEGGLQLIVKGE